MKGKSSSKAYSSFKTKLGLPVVFLICTFFFLAGLYCSTLFVQNELADVGRARPRFLESTEEDRESNFLASGETGDDSLTSIPFQILSWYPRALYFPNFATPEQCESIINMAQPSLKPSALALREGETEDTTKDIRTSAGMFLSASEDKTGILGVIEEKIAKVTMLPRTHGEAFNILRYNIGQKYNSHYDAFHPSEYGPQKSQRVASFLLYLSDVEEGGETMFPYENGSNTDGNYDFQECIGLKVKPRRGDGLLFYSLLVNGTIDPVASFLLYLSDVEEGGETMFPYENGSNTDGNYDFQECIGLKVKPRRGDGLLFYSLLVNGTIDPTSLHGSCPVIKGEKWVATKWIRDEEQFD